MRAGLPAYLCQSCLSAFVRLLLTSNTHVFALMCSTDIEAEWRIVARMNERTQARQQEEEWGEEEETAAAYESDGGGGDAVAVVDDGLPQVEEPFKEHGKKRGRRECGDEPRTSGTNTTTSSSTSSSTSSTTVVSSAANLTSATPPHLEPDGKRGASLNDHEHENEANEEEVGAGGANAGDGTRTTTTATMTTITTTTTTTATLTRVSTRASDVCVGPLRIRYR